MHSVYNEVILEERREKVDQSFSPGAGSALTGSRQLSSSSAILSRATLICHLNSIQAYMLKALHEAKVHTSWINPNPAYDEAVQHYVATILDPQANAAFLDDFHTFQRRISHYGMFNSLSQTLLKITAPGVPDTYQGTELWDLSLVDPDNRRPVDYARRHEMLRELRTRMASAGGDLAPLIQEHLTSKADGCLNLYITALVLDCRRAHPGLFSAGDYLPAQGHGAKREHVFGFGRCQGNRQAMVVAPRLIPRLLQNGHEAPLGGAVWQDTRLRVPGINPQQTWRHMLTGEPVRVGLEEGQPTLSVAELMAHVPVALLMAQT